MPSTGDSLTVTAEENSSKRLLVLHKSETGLKIGRQTGESKGVASAPPLRFTAAGNADRKPFLRVSCAVFLGSTFFEVGVKNNAVIFNNRITIEKTGDFWVTPRLV